MKYFGIVFVFTVLFSPGVLSLQCHVCTDTNSYSSCGFLQVSNNVECVSEVSSCFTSISESGNVIRGCLVDESSCTSTDCNSCNTDNCNSAQIFTQSCISCTSNDVDRECTFEVPEIGATCDPTPFDKAGCYLMNGEGGQVRRGCLAELEDPELNVCLNGNDNCKVCHGSNCNQKASFQRCYKCDSKNDEYCVHLPAGNFIGICDDYLDTCATYVIPDGETVRGCTSELNPEPTYCPSTNCDVCDANECNSRVIPFDRRMCYQCSHEQASCMEEQSFLMSYIRPCNTFNFEDKCYSYVNEDNEGFRGCMSDSDSHTDFCTANPDKCTICDSSNCNKDFLVKNPTLSCVKCEETDPACEWGYYSEAIEVNECKDLVTEETPESCYVYNFADGTVKRGCTVDDSEFCKTHECKTCTDSMCNNAPQIIQTCIACNSTQEYFPTCGDKAQDLLPIECEHSNYENRGCFSVRDETDIVYRGCWNDITSDLLEICNTNEKRCTRCYGEGCNTNYQGAASSIMPFASIIGISIFLTSFFNSK